MKGPGMDKVREALVELVALYQGNSHATPIDEANGNDSSEREKAAWTAAREALSVQPAEPMPIDMVLYCPACGMQHVDEPEDEREEPIHEGPEVVDTVIVGWDNPPHRSHLCHGCGHVWRPADVPTNGVAAIKTKGKADSPIGGCAQPAPSVPAVPDGWQLVRDTTSEERSWPDDASHENGSYFNTCVHCLRGFIGHKRRVVCRVCAAPHPAAKGGAE